MTDYKLLKKKKQCTGIMFERTVAPASIISAPVTCIISEYIMAYGIKNVFSHLKYVFIY